MAALLTPEQTAFKDLYRDFISHEGPLFSTDQKRALKQFLKSIATSESTLSSYSRALRIAMIGHREIGLGRQSIIAIILYVTAGNVPDLMQQLPAMCGQETRSILQGLIKASELYKRHLAVESDNFRKLLVTIAQDVRVIMIMIVERLDMMRHLSEVSHEEQINVAREVSYLYAPLAHRMGLYAIKTELEDLSLKYTAHDTYKEIAKKLNETKRSRDAYIANFIEPVKQRLQAEGLTFSIKGRTKSIYSIWNKIRKQQVPFEKVYDLFAIRIIIDVPLEKEKAACWQAFSVVTNMYSYNTNRLRDWISAPKSNGYESLHVTVMGPEGKWVEVQIRTKRMDEIAEKGVAAHWKYKGGKSDSAQMDEWLKNLRDLLENSSDSNNQELMNEFKMQLYEDDVFVFTPKGDLHRLRKGATILDFAFSIHSNIGSHCVGAIVNNRHVTFKYVLENGDQVTVLTAPNQTPKREWLNVARTTKARTKIKQAIKELENKAANDGRELLLRRLKNWKIEYTDGDITRLMKKMGYKNTTDFYLDIFNEKINLQTLRERLSEVDENSEPAVSRTADGFVRETELEKNTSKDDALIINDNIKDLHYSMAKCCNPIYGDEIFGFVTVNGGIKIHRKDCPNAPQMFSRFGYRIVQAKWSGENSKHDYTIRLHVVGHDDIGIVTNLTSLIDKEPNVMLRSISVDSRDGLFIGNLTIVINELHQLEQLIKKLQAVKGVKQVSRN